MADSNPSFAEYQGARGSNAGDQFHELWALQRALELLDPSSSVKAITVEGVASETADEDRGSWDGVDCALYYEGTVIEAATKVEIAQLKYSSANPQEKWSIARLTRNTKQTGNNSMLRRLAVAFNAARSKMKPKAELMNLAKSAMTSAVTTFGAPARAVFP